MLDIGDTPWHKWNDTQNEETSVSYFVISGEDGVLIRYYADAESLKAHILEAGYTKFKKSLGSHDEICCWGDDSCLIVKGDMIQPKPKKVVEDWDI
jgi:hypothetical protein